MEVGDFAPEAVPSPESQRDALRKGLGRVVIWANAGRLDELALLDACEHDHRFDQQVDDSRGNWLWGIVESIGAQGRFRDPLLLRIRKLEDERDAGQLCEIALKYAMSGDTEFRARLYEIVETKPFEDWPSLGEEQLIALDSEQGFMFAARIRGLSLPKREWEWDDNCLINTAVEHLGQTRVDSLIESCSDPAQKRFFEGWRANRSLFVGRTAEAHIERMKNIAVEDVIAAAESEPRQMSFRGWGKHAEEGDLAIVFESLLIATEPSVIANYLRVFATRKFPRIDDKPLELTQHDDIAVRRAAYRALEMNSHPSIRELALKELRGGTSLNFVVPLFVNNYEQEDERLILDSLRPWEESNEWHWTLMSVLEFLEKRSEADFSKLALVAYASTPCCFCRNKAATLLIDRKAAPTWMLDECKYDCDEATRKLVGG